MVSPRLVSAVLVLTVLAVIGWTTPAAAVDLASGAVDVAQGVEGGQEAVDDGTRSLRLVAVLLGLLALLLGFLTRWYWKATTPLERREYVPERDSTRYGDRHG